MANEVSKPDFSYQWSSGGSIVAPSNVKIQTGWTAEVPPFQWENWSQNRQDNAILHLFQKGISEWDAASNYYFTTSGVRSYVQGSDGLIYVAEADSLNQNPTTDTTNTYWKLAFKNQTGSNVYALDTGTANTYKADFSPVVKAVVDGMVLKIKALNANTGASTFTPANGVITAAAVVGSGHTALQGGEIVANSDLWLQWNSSIGGGSWVLLAASGGGLQVAAATKSNHALQLGQATGRLLNIQTITSTGTYTPTAGTNFIEVELVGGGGGGGTALPTTASQVSAGSGGAGGGYARKRITTGFSGVTMTIGAGGTAAVAGGSTSFGGLVSASGGGAGGNIAAAVNSNTFNGGSVGGIGSGGDFNARGGAGSPSFYSNPPISGKGGFSYYGEGGFLTSGTQVGNAGETPGSGGSGGSNNPSVGTNSSGGSGKAGQIVIWEYA
jgi:hypothetical protein